MQRRRLLRANRRPTNSFEDALLPQPPSFNLLEKIHDQNVFLKLLGITLQLSREAGVPENEISSLQSRLFNLRGICTQSLLNEESNKFQSTITRGQEIEYDFWRKFMRPQDLSVFIENMQQQVKETEGRKQIIFALKKYISEKEKTINGDFIRKEACTRGERFKNRINANRSHPRVRANNCPNLSERQVLGRIQQTRSQSYQIIREYTFLKSLMGHSFFEENQDKYCPIWNVIFDSSEKMIISAGQDGAIKVWNKDNGALLANLRGHQQFVSKICITKNNKYLLSSGHEGVRFFDLCTMTSMGGFNTEDIVDIGEICINDQSYIVFCNNENLFVLDQKTMITHKNKKLQPHNFRIFSFKEYIRSEQLQNCNILMINPSNYLFLGFISGEIIIVNFENIFKVDEIQGYIGDNTKAPIFKLPIQHHLYAHTAEIVQIKWNPLLSYFCTGSKKDGVCKVWEMKNQDLQGPMVIRQIKIPKLKVKRKRKNFSCNYICWNSTFTHVACSFMQEDIQQDDESRGDGDVVIYNSVRGEVTWQMGKTIDLASIKCMDSHPIFSNVLLICDNNGKILLADIYENLILNVFEERAFHLMHPQFNSVPSQCRFSQDGLTFVVSTEYGNFSIYGYDIKEFYYVYPTQQFFQNQHKKLQIDPLTLKAVENLENPIDINQFPRGKIQNIRRQPYQNLPQIDVLSFINNTINQIQSKMKHQNTIHFPKQELQRLMENYFEHQMNMKIYKQNLQDLENRRLTIMYEEQQCRQEKLKQIIKQKIQMIKAVQNISFSQNLSVSEAIGVNSSQQSRIPTRNTSIVRQEDNNTTNTRRRRNRQSRNTTTPHNQNRRIWEIQSESQPAEEQDENVFEEEYVENSEDVGDLESDNVQIQDQSFQEVSSEIVCPRNRRDRNRRDRSRRNKQRNPYNQILDEIPRTRRRNPQEDIEDLMNGYQQFSRLQKRIKKDDDSQQDDGIILGTRKRLLQMQHKKQQSHLQCLDCQNQSQSTCSICKQKAYCESCKLWRGKRYKNHQFCCFNCIFKNNEAPESKKNIANGSYMMSTRTQVFVPQIGDEVAYFFQGYEEFIYEKIQLLNNRFIYEGETIPNILPHIAEPTLINIQKLTVKDIQYCFPLKESTQLNFLSNRARGNYSKRKTINNIQMFLKLKNQNHEFWIYFIPGYQFIIKWSIYTDIIHNDRYNKFQLFDMASMKDQSIQIMQVKPFSILHPLSIWKNIIIHKGETKNLRHKDKNQDIAVNIWSINGFVSDMAFRYVPEMCQYQIVPILTEIAKIKNDDQEIKEFFTDFVNTEVFIHYYEYVEVGVCLNLIEERLKASYYQTQASFIRDVHLIVENAIKFNTEINYVTNLALKLSSLLLKDENYNPINHLENHNEEHTEKKNTSKKKGTSSSHDHHPQTNEKKPKPIVSNFNEQSEQLMPAQTRTRGKKYNFEQEEDQEEGQKYLQPSCNTRKSTRLQNRNVYNINNQANRNYNSRLTRSKVKNL